MAGNGNSNFITVNNATVEDSCQNVMDHYCEPCKRYFKNLKGLISHEENSKSHKKKRAVLDNSLRNMCGNPISYELNMNSTDFNRKFLELLITDHGSSRIKCNSVYQKLIKKNRNQRIRNTEWSNLKTYVEWLERNNLCAMDKVKHEIYIQYIGNLEITNMESQIKAEHIEQETEQKNYRLQTLIESGNRSEMWTDKSRPGVNENIQTKNVQTSTKSCNPVKIMTLKEFNEKYQSKLSSVTAQKRKISTEETDNNEGIRKKIKLEDMQDSDCWISKGIVVKILSKNVGEEFFNKKAIIIEEKDDNHAIVVLVDTGDKVKVHQADIRTVLPAIGKQVQVVKGPYKGNTATLESIEEEDYACTICLNSGPKKGKILSNIEYENICKIYY